METKCINIRLGLKQAMNANYFSRDIYERLGSLRGMILRLYQTNLQTVWIEELLKYIESFILELSTQNAVIIDKKLEQIEQYTLGYLVTDLRIPPAEFTRIYTVVTQLSRQKLKLCETLPKFLAAYMKLNITQYTIAKNDFEHHISNLFTCFQIPYNFYVQAVANKHFENTFTYDMSKLDDFLSLFFGSIENYKFYVKIARVVEPFKQYLEKGFFPYEYNITLTVINKEFKDDINTLAEGQTFEISPLGIKSQKYRGDKLVIFGRHPGSDICFPQNDKMIDYVALILFNLSNNVYAMDVSKKTNIGVKLENKKSYVVQKGMLINIAKTQTFHVEDIQMVAGDNNVGASPVTFVWDDDQACIDSYVIVHFIQGIYEGNKFTITTKTRTPDNQKLIHAFGCGGGGEAPDFYIPKESGISKKHLEFHFNSETKEWSMLDNNSTNGSYILLKNLERFLNKRYSDIHFVFDEIKPGAFKALLVGKYVFFFTTSNSS